MNTNESNTKKTIICSWCSYDANPVEAKHCQKCGKPLVKTSEPVTKQISKATSYVFWLSLLAPVLLLASVGIYFFWQKVPSESTPTAISNTSDNNSSDIKLFNSMKDVSNVPSGTFNYGGSVIFAALTTEGTNKAINKAHPKFQLSFTEPKANNPGNATGILMLLDGELSFAQSSKPLEDAHYNKAKERGFSLQQVPIAIDGFLLFTHKDLSIPGLAVDQIQDIFKGKITNWKQVGGPDLPITAFAFNPKFGAALNILLGPELNKLSSKVEFMRDYTDGVRKVSATPGAIGIGSTGAILGQKAIRPLAIAPPKTKNYVPPFTENGKQINAKAIRDGTYPLTRRLFVVIRRDGTLDEAAGVAYTNLLLSQEGQQYVEKAGFIPIRSQ